MLVLSRKVGEDIRIGHDIRIHVVEVRPDRVRLAFDAPRGTSIHRGEIYEAIERQRKAANDANT